MALADDLKDDAANMFDLSEFGVAATYTPSGCPPQSITVLQGLFSTDMHRDYRARVCEFAVLTSDIAEPAEGDTIQIGMEIWTVRIDGERYQPHGNGYIWRVWATKGEARRY